MDEIKVSMLSSTQKFQLSVKDLKKLTTLDNEITEQQYKNEVDKNYQVKYADRLLRTKILTEDLGGIQNLLDIL